MSDFPSQHEQIAFDVYTVGGTHLVLATEISSAFERLEALRLVNKWARTLQGVTDEALRCFARRLLLNRILRVDNVTLVETVNVSEGYVFVDIVYSCSGTTVTVADMTMSDGKLPPNTPAGRGFARRRETDGLSAGRCGTQLDASDPYADDPGYLRNLCSVWGDGEMIKLSEFAKCDGAAVADIGIDNYAVALASAYAAYAEARTVLNVTTFYYHVEAMAAAAEQARVAGRGSLGASALIAMKSGRKIKAARVPADQECVPSVGGYVMLDTICLLEGSNYGSDNGFEGLYGFDDGGLDAPFNTGNSRVLMPHPRGPSVTGRIGQGGACVGVDNGEALAHWSSDGLAGRPRFQHPVVGFDDGDLDAPINTGKLRVLTRHNRGLGVAGTVGQDGDCVGVDSGEVLANRASDGSAAQPCFQPVANKVAGLSLSLS